MHTVRNALAVVNTFKSEAPRIARAIAEVLASEGVQCDLFEYAGTNGVNPFAGHDLAITLGGDGTVLFAARYCASRKIPVFPVNLGEFGFIAGIDRDSWETPLREFLHGKRHGVERTLLSAEVRRAGRVAFASEALNDAVVSGSGIAKIVNLEVQYNGIPFGTYRADGIIVATATGSTAYSAASGGPILDPELAAFVLTPICAFSLSNRPIVLPSKGTMEITVLGMRHRDTILTIDGQEVFSLEEGDTVVIREAPARVRLVGCDPDVFYGALRSKLNWSGNPVVESGGRP